MRFSNKWLLFLFFPFLTPFQLQAETENGVPPQMFTFHFENDAFVGRDYHYTNGMKFALTSVAPEDNHQDSTFNSRVLSIGRGLPLVGRADFKRSLSLAIGQKIYTPKDKGNPEIVEDDRPYAGVTYLEMGISGQNYRNINTWLFVLGIIGPHAYGEQTQNRIHGLFNWEKAEGWEHQIKDEPVVNLFFSQRRRIAFAASGDGWSGDVIPAWGVGLGNLYTGVQAGAQIRLGWNLPEDFGAGLIRMNANATIPMNEKGGLAPERPYSLGIHFFAGADGQYCLRNITLDGNTFRDSHSIGKKTFVGTFMAGLGITLDRYKFCLAYIHRTKEFEGQSKNDAYGTVSLNYIF